MSIGMQVLDFSKVIMYDFYYNYICKKYPNNHKLCYGDTDSLVIEIETPDVF